MNKQKSDFAIATERKKSIPFMGNSLCKDILV